MQTDTIKIKNATDSFFTDKYCIEDAKEIAATYKSEKSLVKKQEHISKLKNILSSFGFQLSYESTIDDCEKAIKTASGPARTELVKGMICEFENLIENYKSPESNMRRIVNKRLHPYITNNDDTLRVKILKQLLYVLDGLKGINADSDKLSEIIDSEYGGDIRNIDDKIFARYCMPNCPVMKKLEALLEVYKDVLYTPGENDDELEAIVHKFTPYLPKMTATELVDFIYINNRRDRKNRTDHYNIFAIDPDIVQEIYDHLLLKKKKNPQYRSEERSKKYKSLKDSYKKEAKSLSILDMCNCLAIGRFLSPEIMRRALYIFAFAFDLKYYYSVDSAEYRAEDDFVKICFIDYYYDNIIRCTTEKWKTDGAHREPPGITIQYSNFVEITLLYWLSKDGCSQADKLKNAIKSIKTIAKVYNKAISEADTNPEAEEIISGKDIDPDSYVNFAKGLETIEHRGKDVSISDMLAMIPADFELFAASNYVLDFNNKDKASVFDISKNTDSGYAPFSFNIQEQQENAAFKFKDLVEQCFPEYFCGRIPKEPILLHVFSKELQIMTAGSPLVNRLLDFIVESGNAEDACQAYCTPVNTRKNEVPVSTLRHNILNKEFTELSRTTHLLLIYTNYTRINQGRPLTLKEIYNDLTKEIDEYFSDTCFQEFSIKNSLDIMLIFLAYCKIHNI